MKIIIDGKAVNIPEGGSGGGGGVPKGAIVIWSGSVSDIPSGWVLCDGQNGTPDLRDRFVFGGGGGSEPGNTGGKRTINTIAPLGPWSVWYKDTAASGNYTGTVLASTAITKVTNTSVNRLYLGGAETAQSTVSILPPYYALCYIMKVSESDMTGASVSPYVFSDEEVCIGEWLGQPLYRRKFEKTFTSEELPSPVGVGPLTATITGIESATLRRSETYIRTTNKAGSVFYRRFPIIETSFNNYLATDPYIFVLEVLQKSTNGTGFLNLQIWVGSGVLTSITLADKPIISFIDYTKDEEDPA